nr:tRNA 2-thiouridine(34) synthase MnmA [Malacoplasma penetrans]
MDMKKVIVGISGGVDSSVSAYLLKLRGYDVMGVFMQNWDPYINKESNNDAIKSKLDTCEAEYDYQIASKVCQRLGIKLERINFIKEYWDMVFEPFLDEYKKGLTPNPDILCNKYIKFGAFHKYCFENFDCDYIATGHYADVRFNQANNIYELLEAKDIEKDQTYFLCSLNQSQLSKSIFPLADLTKKEVREIANKIGLDNWDKKDSTGICFIGERNFKNFLHNYIDKKPGKIIDIDTSKEVGTHEGIHFYTIGQRKGLNLGGNSSRYFVCKKDISNNILYVTSNESKLKNLSSVVATCSYFNWIGYVPNNNKVEIRIRHSKNKINGHFKILKDNVVQFEFDSPEVISPGQYIVAYQKGVCLGGGPIKDNINE